MTKGGSLSLTLMNYEETKFASDGRGVTVPAFQNPNHKNSFLFTLCYSIVETIKKSLYQLAEEY